jgi:glycosyltransferase involved in cell wall biosynthesis
MDNKFLYLTQSNINRIYLLDDWERTPVVFNFSHTDISNYQSIMMPANTTWTAGRNMMIDFAKKHKDTYDYIVLCDDDIGINFDEFEEQVIASGKAVVFPNYFRYKHKAMRAILSARVSFFGSLDNCCIAIRTDILDAIQYDTRFDTTNWWASALIFQSFLRTHMFNNVDKIDTECINKLIHGVNTDTTYPHNNDSGIICRYIRNKLNYKIDKIIV